MSAILFHDHAYRLASVYRPYLRDVLALQAGILCLLRQAGGVR
jgi:hypothetical protein